jgi:hypothetical protein
MKALIAFIASFALATAYPPRSGSPADRFPAAISFPLLGRSDVANCEPGKNYCYQQIVQDLSKLTPRITSFHKASLFFIQVSLPHSSSEALIALLQR